MKKCMKCSKKYYNDVSFCNVCGERLVSVNSIKKKTKGYIIIALIIVAIVSLFGVGITLSEQKKINDEKQAIENYKYQKAVQEDKLKPTKLDLKVNSDWTKRISGNYIYINGSVTNTSSTKTISYFEVQAKFYDSYGNVIDSDWTNDGTDLLPGETRKFEIMHKYDNDYNNIKLLIENVS